MFGTKKDIGSILKGFTKTIDDLDSLVEQKGEEMTRISVEKQRLELQGQEAASESIRASLVLAKLKDIIGD